MIKPILYYQINRKNKDSLTLTSLFQKWKFKKLPNEAIHVE